MKARPEHKTASSYQSRAAALSISLCVCTTSSSSKSCLLLSLFDTCLCTLLRAKAVVPGSRWQDSYVLKSVASQIVVAEPLLGGHLQAEEVLGGTHSSRLDAEVLADQSVLNHYKRMTGNEVGSSSSAAEGPGGAASKQRPIEGECAICYDTLEVCSPP